MIIDAKCRLCRRAGKKLFLKGERCETPKCALIKKNYIPGAHGLKRRQRLSSYGSQLRAKQALKYIYGLNETQMANLAAKSKNFDQMLMRLEMRLDNLCYRLGFFPSRRASRQAILHGKIKVNDKKMTFPAAMLKIKDKISIGEKKEPQNRELAIWLKLDAKNGVGEIIEKPDLEQLKVDLSPDLIMEFYSH